jgi:hypothetical protein
MRTMSCSEVQGTFGNATRRSSLLAEFCGWCDAVAASGRKAALLPFMARLEFFKALRCAIVLFSIYSSYYSC